MKLTESECRASEHDESHGLHFLFFNFSFLPMRVAVIPGDGIGKEVVGEAVRALGRVADVFGGTVAIEQIPWGADYYLQTGVTVPANGYAMLRDEFDAVLVGALGDPRVPDHRHARDILLGMRFELDLYVNYRPVVLFESR